MKWKNLLMPKGIDREHSKLEGRKAQLVIQPLERGFGLTVGNALRRTLLSSIQGAAITAVKIEGVRHELSIVPGVIEDVTDIILNLKNVVFDYDKDEPAWCSLESSTEGLVTAGMIQVPEGVRIVNPDLLICTLGENATFSAKLYIDFGRGYVDREEHSVPDETIGVIKLDANFSPVRKVSYRVEDTRVGQRTDYDRLVLEIETDGSIGPEDSLGHAAKILKDHMQLFINFDEKPIDRGLVEIDENTEKLVELLKRSVDELELSVRSANCLKAGHIDSLFDLVTKSESEMLKFRNFGRKSLNEIGEILEGMGLRFGMTFDEEIARLAIKVEPAAGQGNAAV
jgi:DNA-directed RNA polymerase subunit alpha